jgi:hypothetical protein
MTGSCSDATTDRREPTSSGRSFRAPRRGVRVIDEERLGEPGPHHEVLDALRVPVRRFVCS